MENPEHFKAPLGFKEKYQMKADKDGYVPVSAFATQELGRQAKNIASLLDGEEGTSPENNLGQGLRYQGASGNYDTMKIHIDDIKEFIERVRNHYHG
ncbi:MAG: hypothetical protein WC453_01350 [Patescibacteria group bacterium]